MCVGFPTAGTWSSSPWRPDDEFETDTMWLQRLYVLFFIELGSRRVHIAGCTPSPSAPWVTQQARQLTWTLAERPESFRFLIRDRDQKFTDGFDDVFRSSGLTIIRTPFRAPQANGVAERFVRTIRSECLDWLLILNELHLERVLDVFVQHYNGHRPHRALALTPPAQPARRRRQQRTGARIACSGAIVSVAWSTSTSWQRQAAVSRPRECR